MVEFVDHGLPVLAPRGAPCRQALHFRHDVEKFKGVVLSERRHEGTTLTAGRRVRDVPFLHEALERAADRCPAEAQPLGDLRLDQTGAGGQPAADDQLSEVLVRLSAAVARGGCVCRHHVPFRGIWLAEVACQVGQVI